jgi:hypothetical protein
MAEREDGGSAFAAIGVSPAGDIYHQEGMSLRDYFAAHALAGVLASGPHDCDEHGIVRDAYLFADAMLAHRNN